MIFFCIKKFKIFYFNYNSYCDKNCKKKVLKKSCIVFVVLYFTNLKIVFVYFKYRNMNINDQIFKLYIQEYSVCFVKC